MTAEVSSPPLLPEHRAIALAASTGGPAALERVLADFSRAWALSGIPAAMAPPFFITQHMSAPFNALLAKRLQDVSGIDSAEASAGEAVRTGRIYVAPDGVHLGVTAVEARGSPRIRLMQTPPVHFCRPAADPMLQSLAAVYGANLLAVILTGMGKDGLTGCQHVTAAGGHVWIQDAPSSVVWGMPGAVAAAGLDCRVLPLDMMGAALAAWAQAGERA